MQTITIDDDGQVVSIRGASARNVTFQGTAVQGSEARDKSGVENVEPFVRGNAVFIRTVTYHCTGRVLRVANGFVHLANAAWIADSGRFHNAIAQGTLSEVEPVGDMFVSLGAIVDVFPWKHPLPKEPK